MPTWACLTCGKPATRGQYCDRCARREVAVVPLAPRIKQKRKYLKSRDAAKSNRGRKWAALSKWQLATYPLCEACKVEGRSTPATVVDHWFPWLSWPDKRFDLNNIFSLCRLHHAQKTAKERKGFYVNYKTRQVVELTPEQLQAAKAREREELARLKRL